MDRVSLGELCAATSLFTDLGTGQPLEHGLRTCLISMRLARELNLESEVSQELFYVSLLRFLGCTADSYEAAELLGVDEARLLSSMAPVTMGSRNEELRGLYNLAAGEVGLPSGMWRMAKAVSDRGGKKRLLEAHCEVASRLAAGLGLPEGVVASLGMAYARWDGTGVPAGIGGTDVPWSIRVSVVARDLELLGRELGADECAHLLHRRRGRAYDPSVVDAALELGVSRLRECDQVWDSVLDAEPRPRLNLTEPDDIGNALQALGDFADLKVPELTGHSRTVRRVVESAATWAGLSAHDFRLLSAAGSVHDVGVVATPGRAWRRSFPTSLDSELIRLHPMWSGRIVGRVRGLEQVAELASRHHERLDGSGYPGGMTDGMSRSMALLACAEFYVEESNSNRSADSVVDEMIRLGADGVLSPAGVQAVIAGIQPRRSLIEVERPAGLTEREVDVLALIAEGQTNRQIAARLGISPKTVGAHTEHIYAKAGVHTRAAATLFAVQNDLI